VLSLEPFPDNYRVLYKNVEENQLRDVMCVNQAVAGNRGRRIMGLHSVDGGFHSLVISSSERTLEVECCTLGDILERFSLTKIDYLKMDCEGVEYEILENAGSRLQQISRISMATHTTVDRKAEDLENRLRGCGFDVRRFGGFSALRNQTVLVSVIRFPTRHARSGGNRCADCATFCGTNEVYGRRRLAVRFVGGSTGEKQ
jgi:FkbM family methyltransferase